MALHIRAARPDDVQRLRDIYRHASLSNEGDRAALLDNPQYLELPLAPVLEGRTRVAEGAAGDILGFATVEESSAGPELADLFVDPACMRRGVGRALVRDVAGAVADSGATDLHVTANPHALAFYRAVGFEEVGIVGTPLGAGMRMRLRCEVDSAPLM